MPLLQSRGVLLPWAVGRKPLGFGRRGMIPGALNGYDGRPRYHNSHVLFRPHIYLASFAARVLAHLHLVLHAALRRKKSVLFRAVLARTGLRDVSHGTSALRLERLRGLRCRPREPTQGVVSIRRAWVHRSIAPAAIAHCSGTGPLSGRVL